MNNRGVGFPPPTGVRTLLSHISTRETLKDAMIIDGLMGPGDNYGYGNQYYVDSAKGGSNSGQAWNAALKTIGAAIAKAVAGDTIVIRGSFDEPVVIGASLTGISIVGGGAGPNQAIWTDSTTDTYCVDIQATDVVISGIKFRPPAYSALTPAAIKLEAGYAHILGNRFQGKPGSYIAIYSPVAQCDNVEVGGNEFIYMNNVTTIEGTCILGLATALASYSAWNIHDNDFNGPAAGIILPSRLALLQGNNFRVTGLLANGTIGTVTVGKMINLSGTGCDGNDVHGNYLSGTYSSGLYVVGGSNDDWAGNYNIAGITAANPT